LGRPGPGGFNTIKQDSLTRPILRRTAWRDYLDAKDILMWVCLGAGDILKPKCIKQKSLFSAALVKIINVA